MSQDLPTTDPAIDRPATADARPLPALLRQLRRLGLQPRLLGSAYGPLAGGAALRLSMSDMAASPELAAHVFSRLRRLLIGHIPATLTIADLGDRQRGFAGLERVCLRLAALLSAPCIDRRRLGIAVHAGDLTLPAFRLVSQVLLGPGRRFLLLDAAQLQPVAARDTKSAECTGVWSGLYRERDRVQRILPAYGGGVRSRCPLLGDEASGALLPQRSILVPPDSAWLPLDLHLHRFADAHGVVDEARLQFALEHGLDLADRLFDCLCWPDPMQEADARLNRRIGITLHGIGDLVACRGHDPAGLDCLRIWDRLLGRIHRWLWERSHRLARERGLLPALACKDPAGQWSPGRQRRDWQRRWRQALETDAVRHRNLLVLSPYCLLPSSGTRLARYADLLPLLAHADACSFAGCVSFSDWTSSEFRQFHHLAFATMQRRNASAFVAAGA